MRAWICPSKINCMSSSSSARTVVLNAAAIFLISADRYGLKYWMRARFRIWVYNAFTCGAMYMSSKRLSWSSIHIHKIQPASYTENIVYSYGKPIWVFLFYKSEAECNIKHTAHHMSPISFLKKNSAENKGVPQNLTFISSRSLRQDAYLDS